MEQTFISFNTGWFFTDFIFVFLNLSDPVEMTYILDTNIVVNKYLLTADTPAAAPIPSACKLPQEPDVQNVREQGTRFGLNEDSRFEYKAIADIIDVRKELRLK